MLNAEVKVEDGCPISTFDIQFSIQHSAVSIVELPQHSSEIPWKVPGSR
jgi:hypothetical protein